MLSLPLAVFHQYKADRHARRSRYIQHLADLPPGLFPYWAASAPKEFQGIPRDAFFFTCAAEALMQFFECACYSTRECALPSKAADSVWHAWLRFSPMGLEQFCIKHFFKVIPHVQAQHLQGTLHAALAVSLVKARAIESMERAGHQLPHLFTVDRQLRMPHGYAYGVTNGRVGVAHLNGAGKLDDRFSYPDMFSPAMLLAEGLISPSEAAHGRRMAARQGGAAGDSGAYSSSLDGAISCDSSSDSGGDSGGDGGSGCGSGCGGGGGGGGD